MVEKQSKRPHIQTVGNQIFDQVRYRLVIERLTRVVQGHSCYAWLADSIFRETWIYLINYTSWPATVTCLFLWFGKRKFWETPHPTPHHPYDPLWLGSNEKKNYCGFDCVRFPNTIGVRLDSIAERSIRYRVDIPGFLDFVLSYWSSVYNR